MLPIGNIATWQKWSKVFISAQFHAFLPQAVCAVTVVLVPGVAALPQARQCMQELWSEMAFCLQNHTLNTTCKLLATQAKGKETGVQYSQDLQISQASGVQIMTSCSVLPVTDRRGRQAAGIYQAFPMCQVVYTLERYVRGKWACCGDRHTREPHAKHTGDVRVYRASSDKIAPGAIPAAWCLLTAWKSPQCVQVYKNVLEFGCHLALGACRPRLSVTGISQSLPTNPSLVSRLS